ncbi:glycosyltransferase [Micromonospora sp. C95]|uniref:glycosyltransferase n=1 Tax=Micromonospora sp. C95 TaxID=2824882 RepID=UPI001B38AFBB|nr:glycosyltransferase [Micromonospora sp. C95]MBQ1025385.1 glycosyltransferase [Micromonospora sp. C95]
MSPLVSVVIPTYNRAAELARTLSSLAGQRTPIDDFEVVVADDGSSDQTAEVIRAFATRLNLRYHYQEDQGARAAEARNAGARLATAPILVFLDAGTVAGPDFVRGHHGLHTGAAGDGSASSAVIGYTYGYRPFDPTPGLADAVAALTPEKVRARYGDDPSFLDTRHRQFAMVDFDANALALPWIMFWSMNMSVHADDFWQVGAFDEGYRGWGVEDLDLGLRLYKRGTRFVVGREAWAIEYPHPRNPAANSASVTRNALRMLGKFPEPALELNWAWFATGDWLVEEDSLDLHRRYQSLVDWQQQSRDLRVDGVIDAAVRGMPTGSSVAVFGCGAAVPASLATGTLVDFDAEVLAEAARDRPHQTHHALGLRTPIRDQSVDLVVITPRLRGMWHRYGSQILAEAHRVGRSVRDCSQDRPSATS